MIRKKESKWSRYIFTCSIACILSFVSVFGQSDCPKWVPTYIDGGSTEQLYKKPEEAWLKHALVTIDNLIKTNASFSSMPEARLRNHILMGSATALIHGKAYVKNGWDLKNCGLIPQADRIAADHAEIKFVLNPVENADLGNAAYCPTQDERLKAFYEPKQEGTINGYPYYISSWKVNVLLITFNNTLPWEPVPLKDYLDYIDRKYEKERKNREKENTQITKINIKEEDIKKGYEIQKKISQQNADKYLQMMEKLRHDQDSLNKQLQLKIAHGDSLFNAEVQEFKRYRSSLTHEELEGPAYTGGGKYGLYTDKYPSAKQKLVRLKKEFLPDAKLKKIRMISVSWICTEQAWDAYVRAAIESFDYRTLVSLMK